VLCRPNLSAQLFSPGLEVGDFAGISGIEYSYAIVAFVQPPNLVTGESYEGCGNVGPRRLAAVCGLQQNVRRPSLATFDNGAVSWMRYADEVYRRVDCPEAAAVTLSSNRNYWAIGISQRRCVVYACSSLYETAYGWYLYGERTQNTEIRRKAESVLALALKSPQQDGAFSTIYLVPSDRWIKEDAGGLPR